MKRYIVPMNFESTYLKESKDGIWVFYDDAHSIELERDKLKEQIGLMFTSEHVSKELFNLSKELALVTSDRDKLKAELDALKARRCMNCIYYCDNIYSGDWCSFHNHHCSNEFYCASYKKGETK